MILTQIGKQQSAHNSYFLGDLPVWAHYILLSANGLITGEQCETQPDI